MNSSQFIEDRVGKFLKNKLGIVYIHSNGWAVVTLATFEKKQSSISNWRVLWNHGSPDFSRLCESVEVTDKELIKLWPHRTRKSCWGEYKTAEPLESELRSRGYILNFLGEWKKSELLQ